MNAPNRFELYVLEDGEKLCVHSTPILAPFSTRALPHQSRSSRRHQNPKRCHVQNRQAGPYVGKHAPSVRTLVFWVGILNPLSVNLRVYSQVLSMPQVLFAGYKVPHPLHPHFLLKIQTDGTITPQAVLEQACTKLIATLSSLEAKFKREFSFKDVEGAVPEDPYGTAGTGAQTWGTGKDYLDF